MNLEEKSKICLESYSRLKNLKLVEKETLIPWQTVYWHLKKTNTPVTGNKCIYGSSIDKFAHIGESFFNKIIPYAENQNLISFQPKIDFIIKGYGVEVKSAKLTPTDSVHRWCFSLKKQRKVADFFVLMAFNNEGSELSHLFLVPNDMLRDNLQTISITRDLNRTKWKDFLISEWELKEFFDLIDPRNLVKDTKSIN